MCWGVCANAHGARAPPVTEPNIDDVAAGLRRSCGGWAAQGQVCASCSPPPNQRIIAVPLRKATGGLRALCMSTLLHMEQAPHRRAQTKSSHAAKETIGVRSLQVRALAIVTPRGLQVGRCSGRGSCSCVYKRSRLQRPRSPCGSAAWVLGVCFVSQVHRASSSLPAVVWGKAFAISSTPPGSFAI